MKDNKEFNHPSYINMPYFVLQDTRLDPFNKMLFSLLWSFAVAGNKINVSNFYLASLFKVSEKHVNCRLKELEEMGFIRRFSVKYKRRIEVLYKPCETIEFESEGANLELVPPTGVVSTNNELTTPTGVSSLHLQVYPATPTGVPYIKDYIKDDIKDSNISSSSCSNSKAKDERETQTLFEKFYAAYPRKKGKLMAYKAFKKLKPNDAFLEMLVVDIEKRKKKDWLGKEPQFIPYPATYLNGKRWEDEIESAAELKRAELDAKSRERELQAAQDKKCEIEAAKGFMTLVKQATRKLNLGEIKAQQEEERHSLGMTAGQYHEHLMKKIKVPSS